MTESSSDILALSTSPSPGALIKAAREKEGLHLAILSVNLKVSVKQLEALEADQFDKLSEPVFARALAAKVCRVIKLDPAPVLSLMPEATNGLKPLSLIDSEGHASFAGQGSDRQHRPSLRSRKFWVVLLVVLFLMLIVNKEWFANFVGFSPKPEVIDVAPVMPPIQEPVATETPQNDLPKAMVFEGSSSTSPGPNNGLSETVPTEVKK
jgi:cytoskeleton protein RodZ